MDLSAPVSCPYVLSVLAVSEMLDILADLVALRVDREPAFRTGRCECHRVRGEDVSRPAVKLTDRSLMAGWRLGPSLCSGIVSHTDGR